MGFKKTRISFEKNKALFQYKILAITRWIHHTEFWFFRIPKLVDNE